MLTCIWSPPEGERDRVLEANSIIVVSLMNPREKVWGQLLSLNPAGITVRGIELSSFDDFVRQIRAKEETTVGLSTTFYPMHRVERVVLDEPSGTIPSLADRFREAIGASFLEYLGIEAPSREH